MQFGINSQKTMRVAGGAFGNFKKKFKSVFPEHFEDHIEAGSLSSISLTNIF